MTMRSQTPDSTTPQTLGTQRIETLVDGVFAIVLTLLVLDIQAPQASSEMELLKKLWDLRENVFSYAIIPTLYIRRVRRSGIATSLAPQSEEIE